MVKRAHGVRGGLLVHLLTDEPGRFAVGSALRVEGAGDVAVVASQPHTEGVIVYLDGVTDRTAAERLRRRLLTISAADRRLLDDDEYWPEDLIGLPAVTPSGSALGTVSRVLVGTAQDRLVVTTSAGDEVEVPFVAALVPEVAAGRVVVDPPLDLFPEA